MMNVTRAMLIQAGYVFNMEGHISVRNPDGWIFYAGSFTEAKAAAVRDFLRRHVKAQSRMREAQVRD